MGKTRKVRGIAFGLAVAVGLTAGFAAYQYVQARKRAERLAQRQALWVQLQQRVVEEIDRFSGDVGLVIKDLGLGWQIVHQSEQPFAAASVVKVPMMVACLQAAHQNRLDLNERLRLREADKVSGSGVLKTKPAGAEVSVGELIRLMIVESDNTATNLLISRLSFDYYNDFFKQSGLQHTRLVRKMMDFKARAQGIENMTSAADNALVLEKLYRLEAVTAGQSRKALELLKQQKLRDRIPARLPPETVVAHKTGLERHICHDVGIIFTERGDLLICVLTKHNQTTARNSKRFIAVVAEWAYQYLNAAP